MSESPGKSDKPLFTEKEEKVLKVAWACLKSGPPDVDMEKLMKAAGFNTLKTTSNTWSTIKKKLLTMAPLAEDGDGEESVSPVKPKATPKKRTKKIVDTENGNDDNDEEDLSPKKKRKTPVKKGKATKAEVTAGEHEGGNIKPITDETDEVTVDELEAGDVTSVKDEADLEV